MNVHEYQGKEILRGYGVATPRGIPCFSVSEADEAARNLAAARVEVIAYGFATGSFYRGLDYAARLLERLHTATGVPAVAASRRAPRLDGTRGKKRFERGPYRYAEGARNKHCLSLAPEVLEAAGTVA